MIELAVHCFEAAGLREQLIGEDFGIANRLSLEYTADANEPLSLLHSPITAGHDSLYTVFDPSLIRHQGVADRSLTHEADDVGGDISIARSAVGLPKVCFREPVFVEQHGERLQFFAC